MKNLFCFSHAEFDEECEKCGYNDSNVPEDIAFISITGTQDCQKYYLEEEEHHWFKQSKENILNISFDDIRNDQIKWKGHIFYGLSQEQAREIVDFVEKNINKDFWIHCRAGLSRSQGVVRFILDCYPEYQWKTRPDNPCLTPNYDVTIKLKHAWREKSGGYFE